MKAFTDVEQSRKLAEILPPESSDMFWREFSDGFYFIETEFPKYEESPKGIRCWSLAALIDILPNGTVLTKSDNGKYFIGGLLYDNLLDACYDMILKLHEQKLL